MNSLRRWLYRPKRSDPSLLAQFYFADEELNLIAAELDGFEGRKNPERCAALVNQLRACQARVLNIVSQMMDESIKEQRAPRDFRVKFPDDVIQENLAGQLWFGAECLAAGSSIMNREVESACMRPLARALTKNLDSLRTILREQCLHNVDEYTDLIRENLIIFDKLFADFELSYVSAMVSVKTAHEYDMIQEITVLFSETVQRALKVGLLTQEMIDEYDPALMFTIPRLAIICGVLIFKDGPLNPDNDPWNISEMFRPFQTLLLKIRELLSILTTDELSTLQRALCSQDEPSFLLSLEEKRKQAREERKKLKKEKMKTKNNKRQAEADTGSIDSELTAKEIAERLEALALNFEASHNCQETRGQSSNSATQAGGVSSANDESMPKLSFKPATLESSDSNTAPSRRLVSNLGLVEDLYREANLDSSGLVSCSPSAYPRNDLVVQGMSMPALFTPSVVNGQTDLDIHSVSSLTHPSIDNDESSFSPNENSENHDEGLSIENGGFSLNKCDSRDSGLQSEVVSNSGSMFTISSSDSNQQILSSDSIPNPSDQNCTDSNSEDTDSHDLLMDINSTAHAQLENSSDSSATIVNGMVVETTSTNAMRPTTSLEGSGNSSINSSPAQSLQETELLGSKDEIVDSNDDAFAVFEEIQSETTSQCESTSLLQTTVSSGPNVTSDVNDSICDKENACARVDGDSQTQLPSDSSTTRADFDVNSNHSHDASCDIVKPDLIVESVTVHRSESIEKHDRVSLCDPVNHFYIEGAANTSVTSHVSEASIDVNNSSANSSESLDHANIKQSLTSSGSRKNSVSSRERDNIPAQQDLSSSDLPHDDSNRGAEVDLNLNPDVSSGANNGEASSSHASTKYEEITNSSTAPKVFSGEDSTPANPCVSVCSHRKGTTSSTAKSKVVCKKRGKSHDKKGRRHESASAKPYLCAHHAKMLREAHQQLEHYNSSDTSSYTSECGDQEEIALAIEAAESATRNHVRARFKSSSDMIHRLFVCISGVADQLQTNFAGDLRNILRCVFDMNCPDPMDACDDKPKDTTPLGAAYRAMSHASRTPRHRHSSLRRDPPSWLPDEQCNECLACLVPFSFLRRRHHCRNCGKIFCGRCSSNFVPLPHFGQDKAVRVCNRCFMFQVTPFTNE